MANLEIPIKINAGFLIKVVRGVTSSAVFQETTSDDYKKGFFDFADVLINTLEKISRSGTAEEARCDSCKGMTLQEAIKILRYTPVILDPCVKTTTLEYNKMLNIAEEAIEKQISKKVEFVDGGEVLLCPCCKYDLMGSVNEPDHDPCYCFECGQALDWGDAE